MIPLLHQDVKKYLKKRKPWDRLPVGAIPGYLRSPNRFESGTEALYLSTEIFDLFAEPIGYWLSLDVESKDHDDLRANIDAACVTLAALKNYDLTESLSVFLTGRAFRFTFPYYVEDVKAMMMMWLEDREQWPHLDSGQHCSGGTMRVIGYRGSGDQGAVMDCHIQLLNNHSELYSMTPDAYRNLTVGRPVYKDSMNWLNSILPSESITEPWKDFLKPYYRKVMLSGTIFHGIDPPTKRKKIAIRQIAEEAGLRFFDLQSRGIPVLRLHRCPMCSRSGAYLTEAGRLKCWHTSCVAGERNENDKIVGLPLSEWYGGEVVVNDDPDEFPDPKRMELSAARVAIKEAFRVKSNVITTMSAGGGKTYAALTAISEEMGSEKIAYLTPMKSLNEEIRDKALGMMKQDFPVHLLRGRDDTNCTYFDKIQNVAKRGFSPMLVICINCKLKKDGTCNYWSQFKALDNPIGLFICTHAQALEIDWDKYHFDRLILDESPLQTFFCEEQISSGGIDKVISTLPGPIRDIWGMVDDLAMEALAEYHDKSKNKHSHDRLYAGPAPKESIWAQKPDMWTLSGVSETDRQAVLSDLSIFEKWADCGDGKPETSGAWQRRLMKHQIDLSALEWLQSALMREPNTYISISNSARTPIRFMRFKLRLPSFTGQIIALDATGSLSEIERLFGKQFKLIDGRIQYPGLKSIWIRRSLGKTRAGKIPDDELEKTICEAIRHLPKSSKKVLFGTHMVIEGRVREIAARLLPDKTVDTIHFFGSRGLNRWQDFDSFISIGTPTVSASGALNAGLALFPEKSEREDWIRLQGENDLTQTLHRIRPVNGNKTIIIYGRHWPKDLGRPGLTIDLRHGSPMNDSAYGEALDRLSAFIQRHKFATKEIAWVLGIGFSQSEMERIAIISQCLSQSSRGMHRESDRVHLSYIIPLLSNGTLRGSQSIPELLLPVQSWARLCEDLASRHGLPKLTVSGEIYNFQKSIGVGYLRDVRRFYDMMGVPFAPASWIGTESPAPRRTAAYHLSHPAFSIPEHRHHRMPSPFAASLRRMAKLQCGYAL